MYLLKQSSNLKGGHKGSHFRYSETTEEETTIEDEHYKLYSGTHFTV